MSHLQMMSAVQFVQAMCTLCSEGMIAKAWLGYMVFGAEKFFKELISRIWHINCVQETHDVLLNLTWVCWVLILQREDYLSELAGPGIFKIYSTRIGFSFPLCFWSLQKRRIFVQWIIAQLFSNGKFMSRRGFSFVGHCHNYIGS